MLDYMDRGGRGRNTYTGNFPGRGRDGLSLAACTPHSKGRRFLRERVERIQGKRKRILEKFGKKAAEGDHPSPATHPSKYSRTTSKGAGPSSSKKV